MCEAVDFMFYLINDVSTGWGSVFSELTAQFRGSDITIKEVFQLLGQANRKLTPWRYVLWGVVEQIWTGECTTGGGMLVRAVGMRNGHPALITKQAPKAGKDSYLYASMATATGTSCAAFMVLAMEDGLKRSGVYPPEDWAV